MRQLSPVVKSFTQLFTLSLFLFGLTCPSSFAFEFVNAGPAVSQIKKIGGLNSEQIGFAMQDSRGFMWLVKSSGLFRYDGTRLKQPENLVQFNGDNITAIVEGQPGNIWIATTNKGLALYNTKNNQLTFFGLEEQFELDNKHQKIDALIYKNGHLYLASRHQVLIVDESTLSVNERLNVPLVENDFLFRMMVDSKGHLWSASANEAGLILYQDKQFRTFKYSSVDPTSLHSQFVVNFLEDSQGRIWLATLAGLELFDRD